MMIWLQTPRVFGVGRGTISVSYAMYMGLVVLGRQKYTTEPLVSEPSDFRVGMATENLKVYKSPGIDQIPAELLKARSRTVRSEVYKLFTSIWNKEELPEEWEELIIVPIYKKGDKTKCSTYRDISLLSVT
jgi:hypothetical protein